MLSGYGVKPYWLLASPPRQRDQLAATGVGRVEARAALRVPAAFANPNLLAGSSHFELPSRVARVSGRS